MSKYNGWTNYATWRVNSDIFDGFDPYELTGGEHEGADDLGLVLKEYVEDMIMTWCGRGGVNTPNFAFNYAMAFLADINWTEIAQHMINEFPVKEPEHA
jgi:hypothetical protein